MKIVRTSTAMARAAAQWDGPVALVPTMGALHAGHLALIDRARKAVGANGQVAVSIFVNPLQFGPTEDFGKYPRPLSDDLARCRKRGVDIVFQPEPSDIYAPDHSVVVDETSLSTVLCGRSRPGHFKGVCTVVAKLFLLMRPDVAVFGMKDYQQLAIIRRMVRDLNFPVRIVAGETVREPDGLALSSRNVYLSAAERSQAAVLRRALLSAAARAKAGEDDPAALRLVLAAEVGRAPLAKLDYAEAADAENLQPLTRLDRPAVLALAVYFGRTRLIDNILVKPARR